MSEQAKSFIERMLTGFFGGWTPTDKLAFVYFAAGIILTYTGKFDPKDLMTFAWGFLAGRSENGLYTLGMAGPGGTLQTYTMLGGQAAVIPTPQDGGNAKATDG